MQLHPLEDRIVVRPNIAEATTAFPKADVFINFASFRRCACWHQEGRGGC